MSVNESEFNMCASVEFILTRGLQTCDLLFEWQIAWLNCFKSEYFKKKLVLRMIKWDFHKEKLNTIGTVYEKHILSFIHNNSSRPVFCGKLTWWNLKGLAKLANLTVGVMQVMTVQKSQFSFKFKISTFVFI